MDHDGFRHEQRGGCDGSRKMRQSGRVAIWFLVLGMEVRRSKLLRITSQGCQKPAEFVTIEPMEAKDVLGLLLGRVYTLPY